ncbi:hypothetical protein BC936DRAFT_143896 [Jimgerdemannia flammicorona]|uniref:Uncharacterized protein n=1 Tax=Jimgerdemannia flammicorona TaxID=994334 RepID=A0A433DD95_9FUNG|nr:hypothetical protein BC936DRAFT_143896 [Jimgerdemannia flammicorona]
MPPSASQLCQNILRVLKKSVPRQDNRYTAVPTSDNGHQTNSATVGTELEVLHHWENNTRSDDLKTTVEKLNSELETLREELEQTNIKHKDELEHQEKFHEQLKDTVKAWERKVADLTNELQRQKDKYTKEKTAMAGRMGDLEKKIQLERSLCPPTQDGYVSEQKSGLFVMDGANPERFAKTWKKISLIRVKIIEGMSEQKGLRYENINKWYNERVNSFSNSENTRLKKSVLKRVVQHGISSQLATIWNTVLLNDPITLRPADKVFVTHDTIFDEIQALDLKPSKSSKIAMLVARVGSEFASLLLKKIPEPMNVENKFHAAVKYDPFSDLSYKTFNIRKDLLSFLDAKTDSVTETLAIFGNEESVRQSRSSVRFLVYLCIHARLQMEVMGNGEMVVFFAGTASDQSIRNVERTEGVKELDAIRFRNDLYNIVDSLSSAEEDLTVCMTISPGVANIKWEGDRVTIGDQIENKRQFLNGLCRAQFPSFSRTSKVDLSRKKSWDWDFTQSNMFFQYVFLVGRRVPALWCSSAYGGARSNGDE